MDGVPECGKRLENLDVQPFRHKSPGLEGLPRHWPEDAIAEKPRSILEGANRSLSLSPKDPIFYQGKPAPIKESLKLSDSITSGSPPNSHASPAPGPSGLTNSGNIYCLVLYGLANDRLLRCYAVQ